MRTNAESTVRNSGPIFQVVHALQPGQSPVGNFVMIVTAPVEPLGRLIVKGDVDIIFLKFRIAAPPCAALFTVEHVNGNVLWTKSLNAVEILAPDLMPLVRQTRDEIHTNVVEASPAKRFEIVENICRSVESAGIPEILITK